MKKVLLGFAFLIAIGACGHLLTQAPTNRVASTSDHSGRNGINDSGDKGGGYAIGSTGGDGHSRSGDKGHGIVDDSKGGGGFADSGREGHGFNDDSGSKGNGVADDSREAPKATSHHVGELYGGGIVIRVPDAKNPGLIASLHDLSNEGSFYFYWGPGNKLHAKIFAKDDEFSGRKNTPAIIDHYGEGIYAAILCSKYSYSIGGQNYDDWFLPGRNELAGFVKNLEVMNFVLEHDGDELTYGTKNHGGFPGNAGYSSCDEREYWTSTETTKDVAYTSEFSLVGYMLGRADKGCRHKVRAVREFTE